MTSTRRLRAARPPAAPRRRERVRRRAAGPRARAADRRAPHRPPRRRGARGGRRHRHRDRGGHARRRPGRRRRPVLGLGHHAGPALAEPAGGHDPARPQRRDAGRADHDARVLAVGRPSRLRARADRRGAAPSRPRATRSTTRRPTRSTTRSPHRRPQPTAPRPRPRAADRRSRRPGRLGPASPATRQCRRRPRRRQGPDPAPGGPDDGHRARDAQRHRRVGDLAASPTPAVRSGPSGSPPPTASRWSCAIPAATRASSRRSSAGRPTRCCPARTRERLLTLTGAHPSARVVHDAAQADAAAQRLEPPRPDHR